MAAIEAAGRLRSCVVKAGDGRWSLYGAPWSQPGATGRKSAGPRNREIKPKPLPWVATGCRRERMVRRGRRFESVRGLYNRPADRLSLDELAQPPACSGCGAVYGAFRFEIPVSKNST